MSVSEMMRCDAMRCDVSHPTRSEDLSSRVGCRVSMSDRQNEDAHNQKNLSFAGDVCILCNVFFSFDISYGFVY